MKEHGATPGGATAAALAPGIAEESRRRRGGARRTSKSRDPHWDNMRFLAGSLVVLTHLSNTLEGRDGLRWLYFATWGMRVPLFAIMAGYFSTAQPLGGREARRLVESVLVPYLLLGLVHSVERYEFDGQWRWFTTSPAWALWFLLALFFWRLALPWLAQLRYPLTVAVVLALLAGYEPDLNAWLSLSRTVCFLPFFLIGWRLRQGGVLAGALRARWSRGAAIAVLAVVFVGSWVALEQVEARWLWMLGPYDASYGLPHALDWAIRAGVLLCGSAVALSVIRLMPRRRFPLVTWLGTGGMYIYLLHPLALRLINRHVGMKWVTVWWEQVLLVGFAVVLAAALATAPVRWLARPVVQPRFGRWGARAFQPAEAPVKVPAAPVEPKRVDRVGQQ